MFGHPAWLAIYPALISSAFFGAGVGLAIALGLFLAFGPRRARMVSQVGATLVGASFVLSAQVVNMLPDRWRDGIFAMFAAPSKGSWLSRDGALYLPARAAEGDVRALVLWGIASVAVFVLAVLVCAPVFAEAAASASGAPAGGSGHRAQRAFRAGVHANLRAKERRLVWRDPWLLSQILMQILYTLPLSVVLWRNGGVTGSPAIAFAPSLVVIAAQMAGRARLGGAVGGRCARLSGQRADHAGATSTAESSRRSRRPFLASWRCRCSAWRIASPFGAAMALVFGAGASASSALVNLWRQAPAPRRMVLRRHAQSKLVGLIEHAISFLWAIACALAIFGSWTALVPLGSGGLCALAYSAAGRTAGAGAGLACSAAALSRQARSNGRRHV